MKLDDFLNPTGLEVTIDDYLCSADACRVDVQWTVKDDYKFHYTDTQNINFRWEKHSYHGDYINDAGLEHYHPPPNASSDPIDVEDSCIK